MATDLCDMYRPVGNSTADQTSFKERDRNSALNFRDPATFEMMVTLTTAVAQILFGGEVARTVEAQDPNHDKSAEAVNGLLAWNDAKEGVYAKGWLWIWDAIVYNRGVWYESEAQEVKIELEEVEEPDITQEKEHAKNAKGELRFRKGEPVMEHPKRTRIRRKRVYSGFYNKLDQVSPYDFICDPSMPITRFQESRFAGHRVLIPWIELKRRSELDPSEDAYVLPHIVKKLKTQKGQTTTPPQMGGMIGPNSTRTYYDRQIRGATAAGIGGVGSGLVAGSDSVNKDDGGTVECFSMTIRAKPKVLGLYPDDEEEELMTTLITNTADVLSINIRPNQHDQLPYCVGEARPNAHRQFMPGWALACKGPQDRLDDLQDTHTIAQKRMGNILVVDDTKCNVANLFTPDKNGLMILRKAAGSGLPIADLVAQIPLKDTTENYPAEADRYEKKMERLTGAHSQIQGATEDPSQTATQNDNVQQMAEGRLSSMARLLSEIAIRPQTTRQVENFKQFMPDSMMVRILGRGSDFDPDDPQSKFMDVKKADIQHGYDVIAHDGSLPGADAKVVAAATRAIEAWSSNPNLAVAFDSTVPGALDPVRIFRDLLKKSGLPVEKFSVTTQQAQQNLQAKNMAQGAGFQPIQPVGQQQVGAPPPVDASGLPSASDLPPTPPATPPPPGANLPT